MIRVLWDLRLAHRKLGLEAQLTALKGFNRAERPMTLAHSCGKVERPYFSWYLNRQKKVFTSNQQSDHSN